MKTLQDKTAYYCEKRADLDAFIEATKIMKIESTALLPLWKENNDIAFYVSFEANYIFPVEKNYCLFNEVVLEKYEAEEL